MKRVLFFLILILLAWLLARSPLHQQRWSVQVQPPPAVKIPKPRPPAEPDGFSGLSARERLRHASTLLVAEGEASPGLVHRYDVAVLEPRNWDGSRLEIIHRTGTLALAPVSLTRIEAREPLFQKIPPALRSRAEGPGPTLVMEFEDLWFEMLRHEKIDPMLRAGFDGILLRDLDVSPENDRAWTVLRLFLMDLKTRYPDRLLLIQGGPEAAVLLSPLVDGLLFLGFSHGREQNPDLKASLESLSLARVLTLDLQDLQLSSAVRSNWESSFASGFLPAVQQSVKFAAASPKIPPESGRGFLVVAWDDAGTPPVLAGITARSVDERLFRYDEIPAGFYSLERQGKPATVGVVPGRTSYLMSE